MSLKYTSMSWNHGKAVLNVNLLKTNIKIERVLQLGGRIALLASPWLRP